MSESTIYKMSTLSPEAEKKALPAIKRSMKRIGRSVPDDINDAVLLTELPFMLETLMIKERLRQNPILIDMSERLARGE